MTQIKKQPKILLKKTQYKEKPFETRLERQGSDNSPHTDNLAGYHGKIFHDGKHVGHFILRDNGDSETHFFTAHKKQQVKSNMIRKGKQVTKIDKDSSPEQVKLFHQQLHDSTHQSEHPHARNDWSAHMKHHGQDEHQAIHHFLSDQDRKSIQLGHKTKEDQARAALKQKPDNKKIKDDDLDSIDWTGKKHLKQALVFKMIRLASKS